MARPTVVVDGSIWKVYPTGRITVYGKDEFGLLFELGTGPERKRRFPNRSPRGRRPRADTAHSERSASWTRPRVSLSRAPSRPGHSLMRVRLQRDLSPVKGLGGAGDSSRVTFAGIGRASNP